MRTLIGSLLAAVAFFPASALAQQVERRDDGPAGERGPPVAQRRMPDAERFGPRPDRPPEGWQRPQRDDQPRPAPVQPASRPDRTDADRDADRRADAWRRGPERGPDRAPRPGAGWRPEPSPAPMPGWNDRVPGRDRTQADRDADRSADAWRRDEQRRSFERDRRERDRQWDRQRQARDDWNRNRAYDRGWGGNWNGGWSDDRGSAATWNSGRDSYRPRAWDRGWRNDRRFDFDAFRRDNRQSFHLPRYYGPSGWTQGYRRFGLGFSLAPPLWSQGYWIADPWTYRLPEAYGPYRWVRYYDDALLVDLRTGLIVDAVHDLFW